MPAKIDVIGKRFGRLLTIQDIERAPGQRRRVLCKCDCGKTMQVDPRQLLRGKTRSCGCYQRDVVSKNTPIIHTIHGMTGSPEYNSWQKMRRRCENPKDPKFAAYGARGIYVCPQWQNNFSQFIADMGPRPNGCNSIDRIDVDGPYAPDNCRWSTPKEQGRNKRHHRFVEFDGRRMPLSQACEDAGINYRSALCRLNNNLPWRPLPAPPKDGRE